jgi:hypothetical protein
MKHEQLMWLTHSDEELLQLCYRYGIEAECEINMSLLICSGITKLTNRGHVEVCLTSFEQEVAFG